MKSVLRLFSFFLLISVVTAFGQDMPEQFGRTLNGPRTIVQPLSPNGVNAVNVVLPDNGGTSGNSRAPQGSYRYERCAYLITAAEMQAAGVTNGTVFTSLGFLYYIAQSIPTTGTFQIYFMNTSDVTNTLSTTWATAITGMTRVDSSDGTIPAATVFDKTLSNPTAFTYTGGGLYVAWEYSNAANTLSTANTALCNTLLVGGLKSGQSTTTMPTTIAASNYRPATRLGYAMPNDASVDVVYTLGKLPIANGLPHKVSAIVRNSGDNALTSLVVTLNITGANTFTNTKTIATLAPGASTVVTFNPFYATALGVDTVSVSVPADGNLVNNVKKMLQTVTTGTFAYSDGSNNFFNGYGFPATSSGGFLAKFYVNGTATLNSGKYFITSYAGYSSVGNTVRAIAYSNTGTLLAQSADYVILAADSSNYITLPFITPPVISNDSVYVGLFMTPSIRSTAYYPFGVQAEEPTRMGISYEVSATGVISDDGGVGGVGRTMIEANFSQATGTKLFEENFDFSGLLTANGYTVSSGGGTNPLSTVGVTGLTFPGYPSVSGNALALTTSGEDDYKAFTADSIGSVYLSFLLKTSAAQTGDYFIALSGALTQTNYYARVHLKATTGGYLIGVSKNNEVSGGATYGSTVLKFDSTYAVVVKYQFNPTTTPADTNNDAISVYAFLGSIPALEPASGEINNYVFTGKADAANLGFITLRQGSGTAAPTLVIDGIRIGTTWLNAPLPVELSSFTASVSGKAVNLSWKTATEINNRGFYIERKSENSSWTTLSFVNGNGSSVVSHQYNFTDNTVASGKYSYRLKQVDFNGTATMSSVVNVDVTTPVEYSLGQNYPNPFNPSTKIAYQIPVDSKVKVELYSITGQKVADLVNNDQSAGSYSIEVNSNILKNIASGVYIYRMTATSKVNGANFISAKKMMLMK